jgi:D-lactate dehydrogenase
VKVAIFSAKKYDREFLNTANASRHALRFFEPHLNEETVGLATGFEAVCVFVNDHVDAAVIVRLRSLGVRLIALRCAGYNNVDLSAATKHGIPVVRVPAYSPYSVAEHTIGLMLTLNRKVHRAYNRVREGNFALDGLVGFDMHGKTVGLIGTRQIGDSCANSHRIRLPHFGVRSISKCDVSVPWHALCRVERIVGAIRHHQFALPAHAGEQTHHQ